MRTPKPYGDYYRAVLYENGPTIDHNKETVIFIRRDPSISAFNLFRRFPGYDGPHKEDPDDVTYLLRTHVEKVHEDAGDGFTVSMTSWLPSTLEAAEAGV